MNDTTVRVDLGAASYDIVVGDGVLGDAGALIGPLLKRRQVVVVTDENVERTHGETLRRALGDAAIASRALVLPPGEASKSFATIERIVERFAADGVERDDVIIAFGGGVVGDLAGFAAAIFKRGCRVVQVPTTLLSQVDSAVGGKTAVNIKAGKNLAGVFHQPSLVIADIAVLLTLPARQLRAGYAEIVKYAALGDAVFFDWLEANGLRLLAGDAGARIEAVRHCCAMKAAIVGRDAREKGERALLNLGHTFGHALEAAAGYSDKLLHGEAVAAGMALAFDYSVMRGLCPPSDAARLKAHLKRAGLPAGIGDVADAPSADALLSLMRQDKKNADGRFALVLARGLGKAFVSRDEDEAALKDFLHAASKKKQP